MQAELLAANPATIIRILGVNAAGHEGGNPLICTPGAPAANRILPWLQDTAPPNAWGLWAVTNRDVVILDTANIKAAVTNLTINDLAVAANYDALKAQLKAIAGEP